MVMLGKEAYKEARKMTTKKLEPMKQVFLNINKKEKCIYCGSITPYNRNDDISIRNYYIKGAGQLCESCFIDLYGEDN